jgi:hypothetical protein
VDDNVIGFDMIELDYDKEVMSLDEAITTAKTMNVRTLIYTTPSHTDLAPRWRLLMPVSCVLALEMRAKLCARVNGRFGGIFASESFALSQSYYFGLAKDNPAPDHRAEVIDGRMIDLCDDLYKFQKDGGPKSQTTQPPPDGTGKAKTGKIYDEDVNFEAHLASMGDSFGLRGFNEPLTKAAASYAYNHGTDLDREILKAKLREAINAAPKKTTRKTADITRYLSDKYLDDTISSAIKKYGAANDILRLNKTHAVLPIGGKTRVVTFGELEEFPGRETIVMTQTIGDFAALKNKYRHEYIDEKGVPREHPMGTYWLNSRFRSQYDGGMAFMPQNEKGVVGNKLNLWRGYGVDAIKPDGKSGAAGCDKFLSFMRDVICSGNEEHFDYLRKREAFIFQNRIRCEVAIGLRTEAEGCGKGFYEKTIGHLLGHHYMQITNPKHIVGAFNPHLETLLRMTADEALFAGSHEHRNTLFSLITEPKLTIEPKGCGVYQADNFLNISVLSNAKHFLPVSGTARRFFIPTVSSVHKGDHVYFKAIQDQLDDGGFEALLYYFLNEVDLTDFNVRLVPQTKGLMEQRDHSLLPLEAWWCELLESATLEGCDPHAPNRAVSNGYQREIEIEIGNGTKQTRYVKQNGLYDQARNIEPRLRNHTSDQRLGLYLSEMGCSNEQKVLRRRGWTFPPLLECRKKWKERFPNWVWRDNTITEWRAEEADDPVPEPNMTPEEVVNAAADAAAKAQEQADRLTTAAETARARLKYKPKP